MANCVGFPDATSILILLQTFLCVLTFISEDILFQLEPRRVSVPAGETAACFLSGLEMKKQHEAIWEGSI